MGFPAKAGQAVARRAGIRNQFFDLLKRAAVLRDNEKIGGKTQSKAAAVESS